MYIYSLVIGLFTLVSCNQKKLMFMMDSLKEQEIKVFYGVKGYPELQEDSLGNIVVLLDTAKVFYTSTQYFKIKNYRNIFCFKDKKGKCYTEDSELEADGYMINVYSNFASDTTNKKPYLNSYDKILIEKVK